MTLLTDALNRILNWVELNHPEQLDNFMPGLDREKIANIADTLSLIFPLEVYELYQWRNGQKSSDAQYASYHSNYSLELFDGMTFIPLVETPFTDSISLDFTEYGSWLPVFKDEDGRYLVVDVKSSNILIIDVKGGADESYIIYKNLTSMMQTLAEFYESGVDGELSSLEEYQRTWLKYNAEIGELAINAALDYRWL
jgi:cell wall assembly regulator SMI1